MSNVKPCTCPLAKDGSSLRDEISATERVAIGAKIRETSIPRQILAVPIIYLPIVLLPFVRLSAALTYWHLRTLGAANIKTIKDFLPDKASHRYDLKNQILSTRTLKLDFWSQSRIFWIFNCTL